MEIIGEDLFTGVAGTGRRGWSKVLAGLADRSLGLRFTTPDADRLPSRWAT
jgi:hypothetical protein